MPRERRPLLRLAWILALPPLVTVALLLASPTPADASTITVTGTGNTLANDGACTLPEALFNANFNSQSYPDCTGGDGAYVDTIRFQIPTFSDFGCNPGTRVCTIAPTEALQILQPVTIDGYTQTNTSPNTLAVGNNAVIRIQLLPGGVSAYTPFEVLADDVTIRGLAIGGFAIGFNINQYARARVVGCYFGVDPDGTTARPNVLYGIQTVGQSAVIGGTDPADRNLISNANGASTSAGIYLSTGSQQATVQGNYIGTNRAGTAAMANRVGILSESINHLVGGSTPGARNVISGNAVAGISLQMGATANTIRGNYLGTAADGSAVIPNGIGITINDAQLNTIGSTDAGTGNRIMHNTQAGIRITSGNRNQIHGNEIFANGPGGSGLGIDLGQTPGVTANDPGDGDGDANGLQNYPILTSAGVDASATIVQGQLNSTPNRRFLIEVYSNQACDPSGYGEGQTYLGATIVMTDGGGNAGFIQGFAPLPVDRFITATATDQITLDTSEFSACLRTRAHGFVVSPVSNPTTEANEGGPSDASFTVRLTTLPTANVTIPLSVSDPTEGAIVGPASLTFTPANSLSDQTVPLRGVDDALDDGDVPYAVVLGPASSADPRYNGLNPPDVSVTNVDNDSQAAQCGPRPKVNVSVAKAGTGQLRATVSVTANSGTTNELRTVTWTRFDTATVVVDGVGPAQVGQPTSFPPLTQSASFVITRTPGAQSGTVRLAVTDVCGAWPTFVGGGPKAW